MEDLRCNNCNEVLEGFGFDYNADVISYYSYDKDTNIYCTKCGKTLSDEIINKIEF